jgi:hypothetical protein
MSIDQQIELLNRKIGELTTTMPTYRGTDRYDQIGQYICDLECEVAMLEAQRHEAERIGQDPFTEPF